MPLLVKVYIIFWPHLNAYAYQLFLYRMNKMQREILFCKFEKFSSDLI